MPGGISINVRDGAGPKIRALMDRVGTTLRTRLHLNMGRAVQNLCRKHLISIAGSRHDTAGRLGATPTGFWGYAAEAASRPQALSADSAGATLTIVHPGIGRAGHDVTITAGTQTPGATLLTIPIYGEAYGKRIFKGENPRFPGGFWFTSKKGNKIYAIPQEGYHTNAAGKKVRNLKPLYLGLPSVTLKQDRTLLPSDEDILAVALDALKDDPEELQAGLGEEIERRAA
jgi:hypothetical protein